MVPLALGCSNITNLQLLAKFLRFLAQVIFFCLDVSVYGFYQCVVSFCCLIMQLLPKLEDYLLIETFGTGREGYNASHCMCLFPGESDFLTVIRGLCVVFFLFAFLHS